jgi:hypothetical protein
MSRWCRRCPLPSDCIHGDRAIVAYDDGVELDQIEVSVEEQACDPGRDVSDSSKVDRAAAPVAAEKSRPGEVAHRRLDRAGASRERDHRDVLEDLDPGPTEPDHDSWDDSLPARSDEDLDPWINHPLDEDGR